MSQPSSAASGHISTLFQPHWDRRLEVLRGSWKPSGRYALIHEFVWTIALFTGLFFLFLPRGMPAFFVQDPTGSRFYGFVILGLLVLLICVAYVGSKIHFYARLFSSGWAFMKTTIIWSGVAFTVVSLNLVEWLVWREDELLTAALGLTVAAAFWLASVSLMGVQLRTWRHGGLFVALYSVVMLVVAFFFSLWPQWAETRIVEVWPGLPSTVHLVIFYAIAATAYAALLLAVAASISAMQKIANVFDRARY